jgi:hypothetical protein
MRTVTRRIDKLENRYEIAGGEAFLFLATAAGKMLALDADTRVGILGERGSSP